MNDPNRTQMVPAPSVDANRTIMGNAPTIHATQTIKPVQCPVCKTFNPVGVMFCVDCGLIFDRALDGDAFGAPAVQLPVMIDEAGREHPLRPGITIIGRQGDIALEDGRISRRHAQATLNGDQVVLGDLGSTNGTKINDQPLAQWETRTLQSGDKVSLGGYVLTLSLPGEANKTAMVPSNKTAAIAAPPTIDTAIAKLVTEDGLEVPLQVGTTTFGRKSENTWKIDDPYASGRHGQIEIEGGEAYLTDLGSTNGTFINDARLAANQRTKIGPDDAIKIGNLVVRLVFKGA